MNITDVDDKTIKGANALGVSLNEYTKKYIDAFFEDIKVLRSCRLTITREQPNTLKTWSG